MDPGRRITGLRGGIIRADRCQVMTLKAKDPTVFVTGWTRGAHRRLHRGCAPCVTPIMTIIVA